MADRMRVRECFEVLKDLHNDEIVVCSAATASGEWYRATESTTAFYLQASMGISSMFALGIADSLPDATVWNFDGDGALMMNIGVLATEAEVRPRNMVHFLLANRVYGATKTHPFANCANVDFHGLAVASGVAPDRVFTFRDVASLRAELPQILSVKDYAFVVLELEVESGLEQEIPIDGPELKYLFARNIEKQYGVKVFGEWGY